jgi:hypothetical protein
MKQRYSAVYLAAACSIDGLGAPVGSGEGGTSGVPIWPASHGSAAANAFAANGQSCLPGWLTTAQLIPLAAPNAHNEFAAAAWSLLARWTVAVEPLTSNQPATRE